jgi:hypothetical protein
MRTGPPALTTTIPCPWVDRHRPGACPDADRPRAGGATNKPFFPASGAIAFRLTPTVT